MIESVTKRWGGNPVAVLDAVDLILAAGTSTWVGGRNGAGKTTLLRIAAGLIEPESGVAMARGLEARTSRARYQRLVSFLPAGDRGLYARLTVRRHLEFWARISMVPGPSVRPLVAEALSAFELRELAERRVDRMSTGQRQRLRIAMTFLGEPEVVLLDEPLASLDGDGAELLCEAVNAVMARGGAVLWCSPSGERLDSDFEFDVRWLIDGGRLCSP